MNATMNCESARDLIFDRRIGTLPAAIVAEVDAHLTTCATCRAVASRTISLLDGAAAAPAEIVSRIDPDALFARIEAELDAEADRERAEVPAVVPAIAALAARTDSGLARDGAPETTPASAPGTAQLDTHRPRSGARWAMVGIAAGFLLGVGGTFAVRSAPTPTDIAPGAVASAVSEPGTPEAGAEAADASVNHELPLVSLPHAERAPGLTAALEEIVDDVESTRVFAAIGGADFRLDGDTDAVLNVRSGTVLVEFVPTSPDDRLHVSAPGLNAEVVGTVFFVTTDGVRSELGVFVGGVRIAAGVDTETLLGAGTAMLDDGLVVPLSRSAYTAAGSRVDLDAHRATIAAANAAFAESAADASAREVEPTDAHALEVLRQRADQALQHGELARAARLLESGVSRLAHDHPWALTARLDLARIYSRRLDRPDAAIGHLRAFLASSSSDVAAPRVRAELCALLGADAGADPDCAPPR